MNSLKIFALQFQEVIEDRGRILVWFLLATIAPLVLILFWRGAGQSTGWTPNEITSYYLFAIVIYAGIMCHQEEHVGNIDIQEGGLTAYLLKPFSYTRLIFFHEVSYRVLEGGIGLLLLLCLIVFFPNLFAFTNDPTIFLLSFIILIAAFALTFIFKMCIGLLAFWMTETRGAFEAVNMTIVIFSGIMMPLSFLPSWIEQLAYILPFSHMIYFPVIAFEGKLQPSELIRILTIQGVWITIFFSLYKILWHAGIKKYTAVGQ